MNKNIQRHVQIRSDLARNGADAAVIVAYNDTISDLREECILSGEYERYVTSRVRSMLHSSTSNSSVQDDFDNFTSMDDTDQNE